MTNIAFVVYVKMLLKFKCYKQMGSMVKTNFGSMLIKIEDSMKLNIVGL